MTRACCGSENAIELLLNCNRTHYERILLSSSSIILNRVRSVGNSTNYEYPNPEEVSYWKTFHLGFMGKLTLKDDENRSWLPGNLTMDCLVSDIELRKGLFTRQCPQGTPAWKVNNSVEQQIPLKKTEQRQKLTLGSVVPFRPILSISGTDVKLGLSNATIITGEKALPLPPGQHDVYLQLVQNSNSYSIKITNDKENVVYNSPLHEAPNWIGVRGSEAGKFIVAQHDTDLSHGSIEVGKKGMHLPAGRHDVYFESCQSNNSQYMKVVNEEGNVLYNTPLNDTLSTLSVMGREAGKFAVTLHVKEHIKNSEICEHSQTKTRTLETNMLVPILVLGIIMVVTLIIQICDIFLII